MTPPARSHRDHGSRIRQASGDVAGDYRELHPSWRAFIAYCSTLEHGEIENLKIQDGLPILAETTRKKVKFH